MALLKGKNYPTGLRVLAVCGLLAIAAGASIADEPEGALGLKVGSGSRLILSLGVSTRYASNYYYQPDNEDSAIGLVVKPSALLLTDRGSFRYQLSGNIEAGGFNLEGDADDYVDGGLGAKFDWQPLTRHQFSGSVGWVSDHDPFGTRRTETLGLLDRKLDRWEQNTASFSYRFGAPQARINLEAEATALDREYTTNRASTQFLDYDSTALRGTVYYRISSKTSLLAEVIGADIDYDIVAPGFASRAGDVTRYRVGARWHATGKTTGSLRIGRVERDFDSTVQEDYDEFDWQASIAWEPRMRDRLVFTTGREPEESYLNAASLIDNRFYVLNWEHDWTTMFKTRVGYSINQLDFRGLPREDDVEELSFGFEYKPARRWGVFGELSLQERDSNLDLRDYENTVLSVGLRLTY
jgi:polysaccharide biosynthesis protein VpsM